MADAVGVGIPPPLSSLVDAPGRSGLLLDYDGSLATIVDHPEDAVPVTGAAAALSSLVERIGLLAVVSGRPVAFLANRLPVPGLVLVGQYGLERMVGGEVVDDPAVSPWIGAVAAAAAEAEAVWPQLYVERKGRLAVTLHWRPAPDVGTDAAAWAQATGDRLGLAVWPSKMARELRPPVPVDKGTALEVIAAGLDTVAFAGDDHGDLAAFDALDRLRRDGRLEHAVRIAVRSRETPSEVVERADLVVEGPAALVALLDDVAGALT